MRKHILSYITITLLSICSAYAQKTFSHGPGQGIDAVYFDTALAPFYHGVASGDPLDDRVIIWTRVTPEYDSTITVQWKVALDTGFKKIVTTGVTSTDYTKDYTVKVDVTGLQPGVTYYYYFSALNKNSMIGRTHTLPVSTVNHLRFAVVSCVNYQMGYFNGFKRISERNDLDAVLHLGDYLYEYATYGYGYTAAVGRTHQPNNTLLSLDDYRIRHSFYKLDQDLRAAHQQHPFIVVWDDHEIVNNTYETGAQSHDSTTQGDFDTRKQNAIRAYLEWMPIRHPEFKRNAKIYRKFTFGNLADVLMLDTRDEARNSQSPNQASPVLTDTTRRILGDVQRKWMVDNMNNSNATWKILGNQVMFSENERHSADLDAWTGYPAERQMVMDEFKKMNSKDIIVLTGDSHRSWAFDITEHPYDTAFYDPYIGKGTMGVELCTPSVASPNRDESSPGTSPIPAQQALLLENPHLKYVDLDNHGYFVLDITPTKAQADYFYVDTKVRSTNQTFGAAWFTNVGEGYLQKATSPSSEKLIRDIPAPQGPASFAITDPTGITKVSNMLVSGIYPNPARESVHLGLILNKASKLNVAIVSIQGRVLQAHDFDLEQGNHTLNILIDNAAPGNYLVVIKDNNGYMQQRKLVIQ